MTNRNCVALPISGPLAEHTEFRKVLVFCHSSYEERSEGIMAIDFAGVVAESAVIIATKESIDSIPDYASRTDKIKSWFETRGAAATHVVPVARGDLIEWMHRLDGLVREVLQRGVDAVLIDISTFPRERMLCLFGYIRRVSAAIPIIVVYTEPRRYGSEGESGGWLTQGIRNICAIPGFNGRQDLTKETLLALVVGHESERAYLTIKNVEPAKVILIGQNGDQYRTDAPRISDELMRFISREFFSIVDTGRSITVGSRDIVAAKLAIEGLVDSFQGRYNICVASYGAKLQTLGVALAAHESSSIRIIHAQPQIYNVRDYSSGIGKSWIVAL